MNKVEYLNMLIKIFVTFLINNTYKGYKVLTKK